MSMPSLSPMRTTFRGSGVAPNTQCWAISLRSTGAAHKMQKLSHPPMRHGTYSSAAPRVDMLALAKHMREWRRGVRPAVRGALRRWHRKAAAQRLREVTAAISLDDLDFEALQRFAQAWRRFALQMTAWATKRAIGVWRASCRRAHERYLLWARAEALRHVQLTLCGWSALSDASNLSTWRAHSARHLLSVAHAHRLRVAARSWQRRCLHIDVGRGAVKLGVLSAVLVACRRGMGRWRHAVVASARMTRGASAVAELTAGRALHHAMRRMQHAAVDEWHRASIVRAADQLAVLCRGGKLRRGWRAMQSSSLACVAFCRAVEHASAVTERRVVLRAMDHWHLYSQRSYGGSVGHLARIYLLRASQTAKGLESYAFSRPLVSCTTPSNGAAMAAIIREAHL